MKAHNHQPMYYIVHILHYYCQLSQHLVSLMLKIIGQMFISR